MTDLNSLIETVSLLINSETTTLPEMRIKLVELDEFAHSAEYEALTPDDRSRFQVAYKGLRDLIRRQENQSVSTPDHTAPGFETSLPQQAAGKSGETAQPGEITQVGEHAPQTEQDMDEAETFFYDGKYSNAIKFYDQVLKVEPKWERARQHRREAEEYLRTGHIPSVALPPEAASSFGKAQSAARLGRYSDALGMLHRAQASLKDLGIQRWQDGQEFEQKLQQYIDAETTYTEGMQLFNQGMIDDGIEKVDAAAQATGLPRYMNRCTELHKAKDIMQAIAEGLNNSNPSPKDLAQVKMNLDALNLQFGDNPGFQKLKERYQALIPAMMESLKDQVRSLKSQAERIQAMDVAAAKAKQGRDLLEQVRGLGYFDPTFQELQTEIEKLLRELQDLEDELGQALTLRHAHTIWPAAALQISTNVLARYPNDPRVAEFNQSLNPYRSLRTAIKVLIIIVSVAIASALGWFAYTARQNYLISLIPTSTPTMTATATATRTATPLPTATATPRPSATPTITPTPLTGVIGRDVWVRDGCYETYAARGRLYKNSILIFLPADRRFDNLGRECVLVEYDAPDNSTLIGWVLIADLEK